MSCSAIEEEEEEELVGVSTKKRVTRACDVNDLLNIKILTSIVNIFENSKRDENIISHKTNLKRHASAALYLRGRIPGTHSTGGWVGPTASLDTKVREKILSPLLGIEPRSPGRPARSQTLY
jgi:hypothetical protein